MIYTDSLGGLLKTESYYDEYKRLLIIDFDEDYLL